MRHVVTGFSSFPRHRSAAKKGIKLYIIHVPIDILFLNSLKNLIFVTETGRYYIIGTYIFPYPYPDPKFNIDNIPTMN